MTAPETMTMNCPSEETLAAFVDGRLNGEARRRVVEHMASCGECRDIVVAAAEQVEADVVPIRPGSRTRRMVSIAAALAAAAMVVIVSATLLRRTEMERLIEASHSLEYRPSSARLSADFPYRAVRPTLRGGNERDPYDPSHASLWVVMADIQEDAADDRSSAELHALGVAYLLDDKPEKAVSALEDALKRATGKVERLPAIGASSNAALLNDLAAAYQTMIDRKGALEFRPLAVEAIQRAWTLEKTPQIAWTRAVIIESLHIRQNAIQAWRDYLALEPQSDWSDEARRRLAELEQPTDVDLWPSTRDRLSRTIGDRELHAAVDRYPQQVREWCEEELLPGWGSAVLAGDFSASERLLRISRLGRALEEANGERDVADAVEAIRRATPEQVRRLATGHLAYGAGRAAIVNGAGEIAMREMNVAVAALEPSLTPFGWRARVERAAAMHTREQYGEALDELSGLSSGVPNPTNVLTGRIHWISGIACLRSGSPHQATGHYLRALAAFSEAGEINAQAGLHSRLFAAYRDLGNAGEARKHQEMALQLLARSGNARRTHEVIFEAAYTAIRNDHRALADLLGDTVVEHDINTGNAVTACTSLMWRGAYRFRSGRMEAAASDLQNAQAFCNAIEDAAGRRRALANLGLARAMVEDDGGPSGQLADLDASIAYFEQIGSRDWLRTAYLVRARMLEKRGDKTAAERDLRTALADMMAARERIQTEDSRISFTATADQTVDAYVEFLLRNGRERAAFEISDRSRARELLDSPSARWGAAGTVLTLERIQAALPAGTVILEYRVLGSQISVWVVGPKVFEAKMLSASYPEVEGMLLQLAPDLPEEQFREIAASLYDALMAPLESQFAATHTIVVVPDDDLERVPYSALYDRGARRYVAQSRTTFTNYSAALFIQSVSRNAERSATTVDAMLLVDGTSAGTDADALPQARRELQAIETLFPNTRVVKATDTSSAVVLGFAADATLLHFAGHGEDGDGETSGFLRLGEDVRLGPAEISGASLSRTRITYLSACDTGTGPIQKAEGNATIARAFFAAGVPVVVATLWPVDDSIAESVARVFYERLNAGAPPAVALRDAQLSVLPRSTGSRADWAAFRVIGAGIPFEQRSS